MIQQKADNSLPYIVSLDAVLAPHEGTGYEPVIKRVPSAEVLTWTFERLLDYMVNPEPDEYNLEQLTLAEQNMAENVSGIMRLAKSDPNVTLQLFVPDTGNGIQGPFSLSQRVGDVVSFTEEEEYMPSGEAEHYYGIRLRASLYDIGGRE